MHTLDTHTRARARARANGARIPLTLSESRFGVHEPEPRTQAPTHPHPHAPDKDKATDTDTGTHMHTRTRVRTVSGCKTTKPATNSCEGLSNSGVPGCGNSKSMAVGSSSHPICRYTPPGPVASNLSDVTDRRFPRFAVAPVRLHRTPLCCPTVLQSALLVNVIARISLRISTQIALP
jgi:hypothetical protein